MTYGWVPPQEPEKLQPAKAGNAFLQGFAGCLGIGAALLVVGLFILVGCSILSQHSHG